jgi:hypothetical protein
MRLGGGCAGLSGSSVAIRVRIPYSRRDGPLGGTISRIDMRGLRVFVNLSPAMVPRSARGVVALGADSRFSDCAACADRAARAARRVRSLVRKLRRSHRNACLLLQRGVRRGFALGLLVVSGTRGIFTGACSRGHERKHRYARDHYQRS